MEIIATNAMISINETMVVQVISFLIFLYLINRIMFRPLCNIIADRENYIERLKTDIDEAQGKITAIDGQIHKQDAAVKTEALKLKSGLEESGKHKAKEMFAGVRGEIADMGQRMQADIEARLADSRQSVQTEAETVAEGIITKILDRSRQP